MISIDRSGIGGHRMLTIGSERVGLRITPGRLDRRGVWHAKYPDAFLLWRGRRSPVFHHHRCSICCLWRPVYLPGDHTACIEAWLSSYQNPNADAPGDCP